MNFTLELKNDLLRSISQDPEARQDRFAFLRALIKMRGGIDVYKKSISLTLELDSYEDVSDIAAMLKEFTDGETFFVVDGRKGEKTPKLQIKDRYANELLKAMSLSHFEGEKFVFDDGNRYLQSILDKDEFQAYFKGILYGGAKLQFPNADYPNYCLQIFFSDVAFCESIVKALEKMGISVKVYERKSVNILQSRSGNDIADILALAGAVDSVLQLNNVMAEREKENDFNRQSNLYMAHYKKAVDSAQKYLQAIEVLQQSGELDKVDDKLKAVALARVENYDASMQELADILGTSKTSLSRYLNKLLDIAKRIENGRK
ncbi:MAG: DNA-binding protein WhiA [Clostridia bacterium]|nr:DNA-binding protein WhiA [Clostridia bacterium]